MTCMHLKISRFFLVIAGQKKNIRHAQGHQRAGALTGSMNIFQSTTITECEVEYRKTVNTKLGKQTIWFSEVIKEFHHYFQGKKAERHTKIKSARLHCIPTAYQSILQNPMA